MKILDLSLMNPMDMHRLVIDSSYKHKEKVGYFLLKKVCTKCLYSYFLYFYRMVMITSRTIIKSIILNKCNTKKKENK